MRTLWNLLSFLAVVNLLALLMVAAWLWQSGRLTRGRIDDIRSVLSMTEGEAGAQAASSVREAELQRLRAAEEQRRAHPPTDSAMQINQVAFVQQQRDLAKRRLEDERAMLAQQLAQTTTRMEAEIAAFERQRTSWQANQQNDTQRKIDEQFLQAVKQLEQLPAKQAKGIIQQLVADKNVDQAVAYLDAMSPRAAAKVLREFKTDVDIGLATTLLERLRTFGLPATDSASSAGHAGGPIDREPRDAANSAGADATSGAPNSSTAAPSSPPPNGTSGAAGR